MFLSFIILLNVVILTFNPTKVYAEDALINLDASSAVLIEASTGQILYSKNAHVPLPPASMSKMMTEYLVLDAIKDGTISWDDVVTTQENAANTLYSGSRIWLAEGDKHTVRDLYIAMAIASANDASVALAEYIAGTQEAFAHRMNEKAREIGLSDHAHFINATGLNREHMKEKFQPQTIPGETLLTAHDAALLAMNILRDHPNVTDFSSITYHQFRERDEKPMENLNAMLGAWEEYDNNYSRNYAYPGADGFKTGYTGEAGNCFTGTAERDGVRLISVVMNSGEATDKYHRFIETAQLFDYGFNNFETRTLLAAKSEWPELTSLDVAKGVETEVSLVTEEGIELIVNINDDEDAFQWELTIVEEELIAPVEKGQIVGTLQFTYDGPEKIERTINLITTDDVEKAGWFKLLMRSVSDFFANIFNSIKGIFS